jgi:hypothetical protein
MAIYNLRCAVQRVECIVICGAESAHEVGMILRTAESREYDKDVIFR